MNFLKLSSRGKLFFYFFVSGLCLSLLLFILYFLLPSLISSNYYQKSLAHLRTKSQRINEEFSFLLDELHQRKQNISNLSFPEKEEEIFTLFKNLSLDREREGIAYYHSANELVLWLGNVIDLNSVLHVNKNWPHLFQNNTSLLIKNKASVYTVSCLKINQSSYVVLYRLLAFSPHLKASYLKEYNFLKPSLLKNCRIDFWDFRENVSGFEKLFLKHHDEYIGQPRLQDEIQTIFFPLRNKQNKITATVTLNSPSLSEKISTQKEIILITIYLLLGLSLLFLLIFLLKSFPLSTKNKFWPIIFIIIILFALRFLFFLLSQLEKIQSLPVFSPSSAGFISVFNLTKSPADIFLSCFFLFFLMAGIYKHINPFLKSNKREFPKFFQILFNIVVISFSIFLLFLVEKFISRLIFNSNINFLHFSFNISFLILHLSLFFFYLALLLIIYTGFRLAAGYSSTILFPLILFIGGFVSYYFMRPKISFLLFIFQFLVGLSLLWTAFFPKLLNRKETMGIIFLLSALLVFFNLHIFSFKKNQYLLQDSLQTIIKTQEDWGYFLIQESLQEIEKKKESILSYLQDPSSSELAHYLWKNTLISKFNWYSSLEITGPEGKILSRFSLNVPRVYGFEVDLPAHPHWDILQLTIPFLGKERNFLIAYKDWYLKENYLGRTVILLSLDYDMLPFLYSANPYFELLRFTSMPSLNQVDFGLAVFDSNGKLLFNPHNISSGISSSLIQKISSSKNSLWATFTDKNTKSKSLYFTYNHRIYCLFLPQDDLVGYVVDFLKFFFLHLILFFSFTLLYSLLYKRKKLRNPFWSFSNRVYISFFAVAIVPLIVFTFFTRSFFSQIYTQQFKERAEIHARFAQNVMEDFLLFQQEDSNSLNLPPENVVLWISSTISNDVNLYKEGKLISSSRREFFDYGLLPELISGETYFKIKYENKPLFTQTQKIGEYSFHTLTIPYSLQDSLLYISLPFPLEQQEISKATAQLIEFLFFVSVFFILGVLLFARGIGDMIITPIKKLLSGTKEVSLGNLEVNIPYSRQDEMKTLIEGFNSMVKSLKRHQQEMAEMSKKIAWTEMARKVAHEIKNPLTPIQLSAEHLIRVYKDKNKNFEKTLEESSSYIIKEVENLRKIAQEFLEFSRESELQEKPVDLKEIIQETLGPYKNTLAGRVKFREIYEGKNFQLLGDINKLIIVLKNLITNAIEAIPQKGQIEIKATEENKGISLEIRDTGTGIKREHLDRIFEPDFSTKEVGTGLGLPISQKIIQAHGGSIRISSEENKGTKIMIYLPRENKDFTC